MWWNLIRMCTLDKKFSCAEVYKVIQSTVAHIPNIPKENQYGY